MITAYFKMSCQGKDIGTFQADFEDEAALDAAKAAIRCLRFAPFMPDKFEPVHVEVSHGKIA